MPPNRKKRPIPKSKPSRASTTSKTVPTLPKPPPRKRIRASKASTPIADFEHKAIDVSEDLPHFNESIIDLDDPFEVPITSTPLPKWHLVYGFTFDSERKLDKLIIGTETDDDIYYTIKHSVKAKLLLFVQEVGWSSNLQSYSAMIKEARDKAIKLDIDSVNDWDTYMKAVQGY